MAAAKPKPPAKRRGNRKGKNWIAGSVEKAGTLREELGVPEGQPIPQDLLDRAAKRPGKIGQRARLAKTMRKMAAKRKAAKAGKGKKR